MTHCETGLMGAGTGTRSYRRRTIVYGKRHAWTLLLGEERDADQVLARQ